MSIDIEPQKAHPPNSIKFPRLIPRPQFLYKTIQRREEWGTLHYSFQDDLFSASITHPQHSILPRAPLGIYWMVVAPCNLRCIHCYGNVEEFPKDKLSTRDQLKVADRIIESGVMRVTLAGGEPLLRNDTTEVIEKLADSNISIILGTNGTYLRHSIMNSIKRTTRLEISLDSHSESINNAIRPNRNQRGNTYLETLDAIAMSLAYEVNLRILTCLNRHNFRDIEALADLLYFHGVRDWGLSWTVYAGRAKGIYSNLLPAEHERDSVTALIERVREKYPDMTIKYSNRTDSSEHNRFSFLIFPDGRAFAEDLVLGQKVPFKSLLQGPLTDSWTEENFNIQQHFKRWTADRISFQQGEKYA